MVLCRGLWVLSLIHEKVPTGWTLLVRIHAITVNSIGFNSIQFNSINDVIICNNYVFITVCIH